MKEMHTKYYKCKSQKVTTGSYRWTFPCSILILYTVWKELKEDTAFYEEKGGWGEGERQVELMTLN